MNMKSPNDSSNFLVAAVTGFTCFVIAVVAAVYIAVPEGANTGSLVALLVALIPTTITSLLSLRSVNRTTQGIAHVNDKVDRVLNGEMDTKLDRANDRAADKLVTLATERLIARDPTGERSKRNDND